MWTLGIWKVQLWHWFSWSLVLQIPSLASWKLGWKKNFNCSSSTRQCLLVLLEKSWLEIYENHEDVKNKSRKIQKLLYFSPHQSSRSRNIRWESWRWKLQNPSPQNSGTLGRKLTKIWWKTCRLFCYGLMQKCKKLRDLAPKAFAMETLVFFFLVGVPKVFVKQWGEE